MIIVLVADTIGGDRGVPGIAEKTASLLAAAGHEVRVLSCRPGDGPFAVRKRHLLFKSLAAARHGISYGKPDEEIIKKALAGADLVHVMYPFALEVKAENIARRMGIPVIATYGLTAREYMSVCGPFRMHRLVPSVYRFLQYDFYYKFKHIICVSDDLKELLPNYDCSSRLHVIKDPDSAEELEKIYVRAIADDRIMYESGHVPLFRRNLAFMKSSIDVSDPYRKKNRISRALYTACYYLIDTIAVAVVYLSFGFKVEGRRNLSKIKGGAITVSNHIHGMDGPFLAVSLYPSRITFTSIEGNFRLPLVRWPVKWVGAVPIPASTHLLKDFFALTVEQLKVGRKVHFYPEGSLLKNAEIIRPFKKGAFHMAADAGVPVIPVTLVRRPATGIYRLFRRKALYTAVILPAVYPDPALSGAKQIEDMKDRAHGSMSEALASRLNV